MFAKTDCCVTVVVPLQDAVRDPHFVGRGLFAHGVAGAKGSVMPALPVPVDPQFREKPGVKGVSPK